jgi:hypothetical protein
MFSIDSIVMATLTTAPNGLLFPEHASVNAYQTFHIEQAGRLLLCRETLRNDRILRQLPQLWGSVA